ncbi:hypothetical protein [Burkholderia semiarida]|uniref:hypothetical protein n=1 Tax=Burkholderia semiarida TaxID=2843303 RepID=UPI00387812E9
MVERSEGEKTNAFGVLVSPRAMNFAAVSAPAATAECPLDLSLKLGTDAFLNQLKSLPSASTELSVEPSALSCSKINSRRRADNPLFNPFAHKNADRSGLMEGEKTTEAHLKKSTAPNT